MTTATKMQYPSPKYVAHSKLYSIVGDGKITLDSLETRDRGASAWKVQDVTQERERLVALCATAATQKISVALKGFTVRVVNNVKQQNPFYLIAGEEEEKTVNAEKTAGEQIASIKVDYSLQYHIFTSTKGKGTLRKANLNGAHVHDAVKELVEQGECNFQLIDDKGNINAYYIKSARVEKAKDEFFVNGYNLQYVSLADKTIVYADRNNVDLPACISGKNVSIRGIKFFPRKTENEANEKSGKSERGIWINGEWTKAEVREALLQVVGLVAQVKASQPEVEKIELPVAPVVPVVPVVSRFLIPSLAQVANSFYTAPNVSGLNIDCANMF